MPGQTLPTFTPVQVESHNNAKSCYITIGRNVYDVTDFVEDHPGGGDLILEYAGKDVREIMKDEISHEHSEAAYEILTDYHVGFVSSVAVGKSEATSQDREGAPGQPVYASTGMSREEDLSVDTDYTQDYKTYKFLDLNKPLFAQLWYGDFSKDFYLEQIHRPRHYKGGDSAPLFGNFLEPLSKTAWYVVPLIWLPCVFYGTVVASKGLGDATPAAAYWAGGVFIWTLVEYLLHRFLFHLDKWLPDNRVGLTLHFLLHGIHHYLPMDRYRLVMPPTLFLILAWPFWKLAHAVFFYNWFAATQVFCGGVFGYVCYDLTHYFIHHRNLPMHYKELKKYHLAHHYADYENGFGVTSRFWDKIFGTELETSVPKGVKIQ
ncbi:Ceramide very long chain fatty acid hydroxylase SCS7 [Penicillium diatomitis]|uniref:Ceramide very long chain fatty acid hydroxylase n=1 Tax=Penicillium diatomitis TaxID=2819901 RepID=A0A9X0BZ19_9EURO|nr:Ceramide very long chain fatty acid hydroxylase SCS7 [Penicillium diatomitis]KAJ5491320.1 Ceramide very long chain fatty acid hydroxylase SCS7 [Penicillium diatomitis]